VTLAGLKQLLKQGFVKPGESVVLVLTGHLLKDPGFTMEFHRGEPLPAAAESDSAVSELQALRHPPIVLDATLDAVIRTLEHQEKSNLEA
jgi:threonine synthase